MKTFRTALVIFAMSILVGTACNKSRDDGPTPESTPAATASPSPSPSVAPTPNQAELKEQRIQQLKMEWVALHPEPEAIPTPEPTPADWRDGLKKRPAKSEPTREADSTDSGSEQAPVHPLCAVMNHYDGLRKFANNLHASGYPQVTPEELGLTQSQIDREVDSALRAVVSGLWKIPANGASAGSQCSDLGETENGELYNGYSVVLAVIEYVDNSLSTDKPNATGPERFGISTKQISAKMIQALRYRLNIWRKTSSADDKGGIEREIIEAKQEYDLTDKDLGITKTEASNF